MEIKITFLSNTLHKAKIFKKITTLFIKLTVPNEATRLKGEEEKDGVG